MASDSDVLCRLESEARDAIEWVDKNESCLEGWFVGIYAFFVCSLVQVSSTPSRSLLTHTRVAPILRFSITDSTSPQYHSHIRRRDDRSLATLRLARDLMKRLVVVDGECHVRAKIAEITHLLYHTACSVGKWAPEAAEGQNLKPTWDGAVCVTTLNPTVGVRQRFVLRSSLLFGLGLMRTV